MAFLVDAAGDFLVNAAGDFLVTSPGTLGTTTILGAIPASPVNFGTLVTLTAQVTPSSGPTGTVEFYGPGLLGSATLSGAGIASFAISTLTVGTHSLTATYTGDVNYDTSTSAPLTYTITSAIVVSFGPTGVGDPRAKARKAARKPFEYDRPYLAEHAEQLRRAMRRKKPAEVREVIKAIIDQPATPPVVVEAAAPLTNVRSLKVNIIKGLYALLDEIERELESEEEDSEMLLLS